MRIDLNNRGDSHTAAEVSAAAGVRYGLDPRISRFTFRAFASGMLSAFGHSPTSDYNIKQVSAIGGGLKVKDEVKFSFDIVARKQA